MYRRVVIPFTILALVTLIVCVDDQQGFSQPGRKKGGGGPGGMKMDPNNIFEKWLAKGRDHFFVNEMYMGRKEMELFASRSGITDGKITREQYMKFWDQRDQLREELKKGGGAAPGGDKKGPPAAGGAPEKKGNEKGSPGEKGDKGGKGYGKKKMDPEERFKYYDTNGDGFLNESEIAKTERLRNDWQTHDTNNDKMISLDEWKVYLEKAFGPRQAKGEDRKGEGRKGERQRPEKSSGVTVVEVDEVDETPPVVFRAGNLPDGLPAWFKEYDTNKDGQVSLMEWMKKKSAADFIRIDRNDDGLLTPEEALRAERSTQTASAKSEPGEDHIVLVGPNGEEPPPPKVAAAEPRGRNGMNKGGGKKGQYGPPGMGYGKGRNKKGG
jgi:hypothetical protein